MTRLVEGISVKDLLRDGGTIFTVNMEDIAEQQKEEEELEKEVKEASLEFSNLRVLDYEDGYTEGEPFEKYRLQMQPLLGNDVLKRVLREGYGEAPCKLATVKVHYNAYLEYEPEPFDSTYARKRPQTFRVNNSEVLPGLDVAVQSMKLQEKSQFLISPEYGYGKLGCLSRIPPNSSVLFEIELLQIIDMGAATSYDNLSEDKKNAFEEVYKYCLALCVRGKELIKTNTNHRGAIREYNIAVSKLEYCQMSNYEEQEKQQVLLLKLYSNLLVCWTALQEPRKACMNANKIYDLTRDGSLKVPVKVYFNHAKCLRYLGDYKKAKVFLNKAHAIEPRNTEIAIEYQVLDDAMKQNKTTEKKMSKALFDSK